MKKKNGMKRTVKIFSALAALLLVLAGCDATPYENPYDALRFRTKLTIVNESFTVLTGVTWRGVYLGSVPTGGAGVTMTVKAGTGYLYFTPKNFMDVRMDEMITVEEGEQKTITIIDNTIVVEVSNTGNRGTLGTLQSTVVFFDSAEGEMQPYHAQEGSVNFYSNAGLDELYSSYDGHNNFDYTPYISPVKNGNYAICLGEQNPTRLHLRVTLTKPAKLSFWVANRRRNDISGNTKFSINGAVKETWSTNIIWSFKTFDLTAGQNDIVWEKTDCYFHNGEEDLYYYLSLDDILVYYTE
jgi:hypothetical protein